MNNKIINKINLICRKHYFKNKKINNNDITIISQTCIGGLVYHDFNLKLNSPTINVFFEFEEFIKFTCNLKYYLSCKLEKIKYDDYKNVIVRLDDIIFCFPHDEDFNKVKENWDKRVERVNYDKIYIICTDMGKKYYTNSHAEFKKIPYKNKMLFSRKQIKDNNICYIKALENENKTGLLTYFTFIFGKRYYDKFDFYKWLSKNDRK